MFNTNLIGAARFQTQYNDIIVRASYVIMYMALVVYTVIFTLFYFRRLIMMAFLTMIAPLVALTYPIDKINDGKAQAFDSWLKEYIYNALIQPFHLIIYTVFVTNALQFASKNIIYMIASLWFVMQAEKILRGFFGFNKAGAGTMGALHTLGLASMLGRITSGRGPKAAKGNKKEIEGDNQIRFQNNTGIEELDEEGGARTRTAPDAGTDENHASTAQAMREIDEESFGTSDFDAQAYDANAREASRNDGGRQYSDSEYEQILRDSGYSEEEISQMMGGSEPPQTPPPQTPPPQTPPPQTPPPQTPPPQTPPPQQTPPQQTPPQRQQAANRQSGLRRVFNHLTTSGYERKAGRAIKGLAKYGTRKVFRLGLGATAGAIAVASGGDLGAALATYTAAAGLGERAANTIMGAAGTAYTAVPDAFRRTADIYNGNNNLQREYEAKQQMKDSTNRRYVRDMIMAENPGKVPSYREISEEMEKLKPYFQKDLNIKEAIKAHKIAQNMNSPIGDREAAAMFAYSKQEEITKSILNKPADREQYRQNLIGKFTAKGKTRAEAEMAADRVFEFLGKYHGVTF